MTVKMGFHGRALLLGAVICALGLPPGPAAAVAPVALPGAEVTAATGDVGGYHLFAASSDGGWRWRSLATIQPGGSAGEPWIGEQCLTGDGRYVVAVVAPRSAQNRAGGVAQGGLAYAVDARTGAVRPLASHLALTYFDPGCGAGSTAALTRFLSPDQSRTEVQVADAATGVVTSTGVVQGEATSSIPDGGGGVVAAVGDRLVRVHDAQMETLARLPGQAFRITPDGAGIDFLVGGGQTASAYTYDRGGLRRTASGSLSGLRLFPGTGGRPQLLDTPSSAVTGPPVGMSLDGRVAVTETGDPDSPVGLVQVADGRPVGGRLPASASPTRALPAGAPGFPPPPDTTAPTCAVPESDPAFQVLQPSSAMVRWAATLAGHGSLSGPSSGEPLREDGQLGLRTGDYSPSADLPLRGAFGPNGAHLPAQVIEGVFAQESNWHQASPDAPQGIAGNPYVADYYGFDATGTVDYDSAGCAYGVGQIADGMRLATPDSAPTAVQQRIAVDYAEDAAAAAQILSDKWTLLGGDGVTIGGSSPPALEDWYLALWAYNTGVNPQSSTGGRGCTPGPNCTDADGDWGLGWTNNPANPSFDPQRHAFLHTGDGVTTPAVPTYDDSSHGQDWPYQEKVLGWMETPDLEPDGVTPRYAGTFDYATQTGFFLYRPGPQAFCDASDSCTPGTPGAPGVCARADLHCWWHEPVAVCPADACHTGTETVRDGSPEPAVADPLPPVCAPGLPAGTVVVDDQPSDLNLAGCRSGSWHSQGTFGWLPNSDAQGAPTGLIDLEQLGAGFGGRLLVTRAEPPSSAMFGGTGTWSPDLVPARYEVLAFIPDLAASALAPYTVQAAGGPRQIVIDQNAFGNQWAPLGCFSLTPGATVSLSSVMPGGDGVTELAYDAMAFVPAARSQGCRGRPVS